MRDRPEFDTTDPVDLDELTGDERAEYEAGMRRLAELRAAESAIPEIRSAS